MKRRDLAYDGTRLSEEDLDYMLDCAIGKRWGMIQHRDLVQRDTPPDTAAHVVALVEQLRTERMLRQTCEETSRIVQEVIGQQEWARIVAEAVRPPEL